MAETPTDRMVAAANSGKQTTDVQGRVIKYRRLNALDRAKLFKAIGPNHSTTAPYVGMAMLAASATEVDGVPLPFPVTDMQIEAAIARLDDDGLDAVGAALVIDQVAASGKGAQGEQSADQSSQAAT